MRPSFHPLLLLALTPTLLAAEPRTIDEWVSATQQRAGLETWWSRQLVQADVEIIFGGKTNVDATFTFEANGPRSKMVTQDGKTIVYDGKTAFTTGEPDPKDRFHVLTWPWFIMAPFKMRGEGIKLDELGTADLRGISHITIRQTFSGGMGDAPDDWYRFFITPDSKRLAWMQYIVTYGKGGNKEVDHSSVIQYHDDHDFDGVRLSTRYTFYLWNDATDQPEAEPKGTGTVKNVKFLKLSDDPFAIPEGATEIPLP